MTLAEAVEAARRALPGAWAWQTGELSKGPLIACQVPTIASGELLWLQVQLPCTYSIAVCSQHSLRVNIFPQLKKGTRHDESTH